MDGMKIRAKRQEKKLSMEKLAYEAGLSVRTIARLEGDEHDTRGPDLRTAELVARALGCRIEELM